MIEVTVNQGLIRVSDITTENEFFPAQTAETTLKKRIGRNRLEANLSTTASMFFAFTASMQLFDLLFSTNLYDPTPIFHTEPVIGGVLATLNTILAMSLVRDASKEYNALQKNKVKLGMVQHALHATPIYR